MTNICSISQNTINIKIISETGWVRMNDIWLLYKISITYLNYKLEYIVLKHRYFWARFG